MKTVFALAALFVAVQASPAVTAAPHLPPVPDCLKPCVADLNKSACSAAVGSDAMNRCFCSNTAAIEGCAVTACASELNTLLGAQSQAAAACSALLAQPAEQPTAKETGSSSATAGTESAAGGETGSASAAATGSEAAAPTGSPAASSGSEAAGGEPAASSGAAVSSGSGTSSSGNGTSASTSPKATGSSSASDRVVVGGSVLLAGLAALLAL